MTDLKRYQGEIFQCLSVPETLHKFEFLTVERALEEFYNVGAALLHQDIEVKIQKQTGEIKFSNGSCLQFIVRQ